MCRVSVTPDSDVRDGLALNYTGEDKECIQYIYRTQDILLYSLLS